MGVPRVTTRGGAGGTAASLTDMRTTSGVLSRNADELASVFGSAVALSAAGALQPLTHGAAFVSPLTAAQVGVAQSRFIAGAGAIAVDLRLTATNLRLAADAYAAADTAASAAMDGLLTGAGAVAGHAARVLLPVVVVLSIPTVIGVVQVHVGARVADTAVNSVFRVLGLPPRMDSAGALERTAAAAGGRAAQALQREAFQNPSVARMVIEYVLPGFVSGFMGVPVIVQSLFPAGPWPHDSTSLTRTIHAAGAAFGVLTPTPVSVHRVPTAAGAATAQGAAGAPVTASDRFARTLEGHAGHANGRVRVDRVRGPDGQDRAVVYVPATTDWSLRGGKNGTDLTTNVETVAGYDSAMREAVRQALREAGFAPGSDVMFVGYSQGGIVAGSLAADADFRRDYRVRALLTAGSPISDFAIPNDIDVVSIEHSDDLIPNLDGSTNPDTPRWTTITSDRDRAAGEPPGQGHAGEEYRKTIEALERNGDSDLERFQERTRDFGGRVVDSREYEARRH